MAIVHGWPCRSLRTDGCALLKFRIALLWLRMRAKTSFPVIAAILIMAGSVLGQESDPERVARRYGEVLRAKDWPAAAALMHPDALSRLKTLMRPMVTARPVDLGNRVFKVRTSAEFEALRDSEVFERLMSNLAKDSSALMPALISAEPTPIGRVKEGPDLVHILFRIRDSGKSIVSSDVSVRTVKRHGREWKLMLPATFEGLIAWWTDASRSSLEDLDKLEIVN